MGSPKCEPRLTSYGIYTGIFVSQWSTTFVTKRISSKSSMMFVIFSRHYYGYLSGCLPLVVGHRVEWSLKREKKHVEGSLVPLLNQTTRILLYASRVLCLVQCACSGSRKDSTCVRGECHNHMLSVWCGSHRETTPSRQDGKRKRVELVSFAVKTLVIWEGYPACVCDEWHIRSCLCAVYFFLFFHL